MTPRYRYTFAVALASVFALFATTSYATQSGGAYSRTGWTFGVSPRYELPTGSGYDNSDWYTPRVTQNNYRFEVTGYDTVDVAAAGIGAGIGAEFYAGYAFTDRFELRFALTMLSHESDSGTVGSSSFGVDAVYRIPMGRFDVGGHARLGQYVLTVDDVSLDSYNDDRLRDWTFSGIMFGAGLDVRYWLTRNVTLSSGVGWTYVRMNRTRSLGSVSLSRKMDAVRDGSVFNVSVVGLSYHF